MKVPSFRTGNPTLVQKWLINLMHLAWPDSGTRVSELRTSKKLSLPNRLWAEAKKRSNQERTICWARSNSRPKPPAVHIRELSDQAPNDGCTDRCSWTSSSLVGVGRMYPFLHQEVCNRLKVWAQRRSAVTLHIPARPET